MFMAVVHANVGASDMDKSSIMSDPSKLHTLILISLFFNINFRYRYMTDLLIFHTKR